MREALAVLPVPEFAIGQTVYGIVHETARDQWPCPDCGDTKKWTATAGSGEVFAVNCLRCSGGWSGVRDIPPLARERVVMRVRQLTIGSIRIESAPYTPEEGVTYMCNETGVGSGQNYYSGGQHRLYGTEAEAQKVADAIRSLAQTKEDERPAAVLAARFSGYPVAVAIESAWREDLFHAWYVAKEYRESMEKVIGEKARDHCDCDHEITTLEEAREELSDALRDRPWRDPHPFDALLAAARDALADTDGARERLAKAVEAFVYKPVVRA